MPSLTSVELLQAELRVSISDLMALVTSISVVIARKPHVILIIVEVASAQCDFLAILIIVGAAVLIEICEEIVIVPACIVHFEILARICVIAKLVIVRLGSIRDLYSAIWEEAELKR